MPRPRLCRRVGFRPSVTYFKPAGIRLVDLEESVLTVDELEALRLKDFQGLGQEACAAKMNISQPTFHRLVSSARRKVADAIVNAKAVRVDGGNFVMSGEGAGNRGRGRGFGCIPAICVCLACGHEEPKARGVSCADAACPVCGIKMAMK